MGKDSILKNRGNTNETDNMIIQEFNSMYLRPIGVHFIDDNGNIKYKTLSYNVAHNNKAIRKTIKRAKGRSLTVTLKRTDMLIHVNAIILLPLDYVNKEPRMSYNAILLHSSKLKEIILEDGHTSMFSLVNLTDEISLLDRIKNKIKSWFNKK